METDLHKTIERNTSQKRESETEFEKTSNPDINLPIFENRHNIQLSLDNDFPLWSGDSSVRRSPEGNFRLIKMLSVC